MILNISILDILTTCSRFDTPNVYVTCKCKLFFLDHSLNWNLRPWNFNNGYVYYINYANSLIHFMKSSLEKLSILWKCWVEKLNTNHLWLSWRNLTQNVFNHIIFLSIFVMLQLKKYSTVELIQQPTKNLWMKKCI